MSMSSFASLHNSFMQQFTSSQKLKDYLMSPLILSKPHDRELRFLAMSSYSISSVLVREDVVGSYWFITLVAPFWMQKHTTQNWKNYP